MTWAVILAGPDSAHVVPIADLVEHEVNDDCVCGPSPLPTERGDGSLAWVIKHHSLDGREHQEPDHRSADCDGCQHGDTT